MLRPRIIPCLLLSDNGLVKTTNFKDAKYVGDPINAVKIFNEKQVDELCFFDIDASVKNHEPNYKLIKNIAAECRMPLCYGGGIKSAEQAEKIITLGVEKIAISSAAVNDPELIGRIAKAIGSQSIAVVLDVKKPKFPFGKYQVVIDNGKTATKIDPVSFAKKAQQLGAGEIVINSIDLDGTMQGYDLDVARLVRDVVDIPMTVLGGAGSLDDMQELIDEFGPIGAAAGSFFVFKGKYRAVLISYDRPLSLNQSNGG